MTENTIKENYLKLNEFSIPDDLKKFYDNAAGLLSHDEQEAENIFNEARQIIKNVEGGK